MKRSLTTLAVAAGLALPAVAADEPRKTTEIAFQTADVKTTRDLLPAGIRRFNGMLVGRLVTKDIEKGTFVVTVDRVPRVWRNSKAQNPKSVIGRNVEVDGVFGKWLDVLLVTEVGETLQFEAKHDAGDRLTFPGEFLRKVAPVKPGDFPELPEAFRGFHGIVAAKIVSKDPESFEMTVEVKQIKEVDKKNRAQNPQSILGKQAMLGGFWRRKEAYHDLKVGDLIETGLEHIQLRSDHLSVTGSVRKAKPTDE